MKNTLSHPHYLVVIKANALLLQTAKAIFGESAVVSAWFADQTNLGIASGRKRVDADDEEFSVASPTIIGLPTNSSVVLEFSNGRHVLFGSSEWASIELVEHHLIEV